MRRFALTSHVGATLIVAALVASVGLLSLPSNAQRVGPLWVIGAIQPRTSADGSTIAFAYQGAIWRIPRDGGVMRRLTSSTAWDSNPEWSSDGSRIAFLSSGIVSLMDAQTGAAMALPIRVQARGLIQFSADGRKLLGNFLVENNYELAWLNVGDGSLKSVLNPPALVRAFALSSDGRTIAYVTNQDVPGEQDGNDGPQSTLWMLSSAGGAPKKIVRFPSRIFRLTWNGSSSLIAVSDLGGAHNDLWEIPIDSPEQARKLTYGQADEDSPSVAGAWLVYTDNEEGATALVMRSLVTREERRVGITGIDFGKPTGSLRLDFVDKSTGQPLAARVAVQEDKSKPVAPPGSLYHVHNDLMDFISPGSSEFEAPAGLYHVRAYHGPEYKTTELTFTVPNGKETSVKVELERWANPQAQGWFSGENHIHGNYGYGEWYNSPITLRPFIEAEDLNVANLMVANSDTDGVFDREYFRGRADPISGPRNILYWNEEFRATLWGHMTLVNLKKLVEPIFTGFADTTNPWDAPTNGDVAELTHLQGGHVNYTHPAVNVKDPYLSAYSAKEVPVDVALGKIDSLDINWNHAPPTRSYEPALSLWYRLLNCGFHLPASAGTDCFLNRISSLLPGSDRAYVKIDGDFSYEAWIKGLKLGRSFVTNGPLLEFASGSEIRLDKASRIPINAKVISPMPLDRFELVYNGEVIFSGDIAQDRLSGVLNASVELNRSGWLSVRAFAGNLQAHASPIYVEVAGRPTGSKADAEYFLSWIDRLEAQLKMRNRLPSPAIRANVEAQLNAAREVYRKIISRTE